MNPVFLAIDTIPVFPHMMWGFFLPKIQTPDFPPVKLPFVILTTEFGGSPYE